MSEKIALEPGEQIVLTRTSDQSAVTFQLHRQAPTGGIGIPGFGGGTFAEAIRYIRDHYVVE